MDKNNWGSVKTTLAMIDKANEEGADIYADVYPYIASSTSMSSRFVPTQFHPPMTTNVLSLLDDPEICARVKEWGHNKWGNDLSWVQMVVCVNHPEYSGLTVNQIAEMKGQTDRFDTVLDILREGKGLANICTFMMCEEDVEYVMKHPRVMMCTDSAVRTSDLPYHPRMVGAFPRILGRYVRERKVMDLHKMIYKMTALPAKVYELSSKGRLAEGFDADICIFNADTIIDHADFVNSSLANEGLEYVLIDGKVVLEQGKYNNTRAAKVYLKG
jgi:N-acyl-D-amino-acid deacylase